MVSFLSNKFFMIRMVEQIKGYVYGVTVNWLPLPDSNGGPAD